MTSAFERATVVEPIDEHVYRAVVPAGWEQGRGAFGGLVLGLLARAMVASEPDTARAMRFLSGEIAGPVQPGEIRIEVTVLRRGKNLTNLDSRLLQNGEVVARASAGLSATRKTAGDLLQPPIPTFPPIAGAITGAIPDEFAPPFARNFEYSLTGPMPFAGGPEPRVEGYVRLREAPSTFDAPLTIALLDSFWPAIFSTSRMPRASATASFAAQILADVTALDPATPIFYRAHVHAIRDGFFLEMRELWQDSVLIAANQQTFALLS